MSGIKLCGLSRREDILAANEARPDYIGFVFAGSRRQVSPDQAAELRRELDPAIRAVGVFVHADPGDIRSCVARGIIDLVQLHGDEDDRYVACLRELVCCPLIRAVRVRDEADIRRAGEMDCDYLLLDAFDHTQYGGSGRRFDWSLTRGLGRPFFLAGGLTVDSIPRAVETGAYALDISSGVETDGKKDREKMLAAVRRVREES